VWFIAQGYARSIRKLALYPSNHTFRASWYLVQQAAGTLGELTFIFCSSWGLPQTPETIAYIAALGLTSLTSLRIMGLTNHSLNRALHIVERCLGSHSARLRIEATLVGTAIE
jgi:hypothetical protein